MSQTSGFFEAELLPDGGFDRVYFASQFAKYFSNFISNGVFANPTDQLVVTQTQEPSMRVIVKKGRAFINGYWFDSNSGEEFEIANAAGSLGRYDAIFVRYSINDRNIKLILKQGSPSANAEVPKIERNSEYYDLMICKIYIAPAITSISNKDIIDTRADNEVCGFVAGIINQLETKDLFNQYSDIFNKWFENLKQGIEDEGDAFRFLFNEWFDTIKGQLEGDQAANLNLRLNDLVKIVEGIDEEAEDLKNKDAEIEGDVQALKDNIQELKDNKVEKIEDNIRALKVNIQELKDNKVEKIVGKQLSTNDFNNYYKQKVDEYVKNIAKYSTIIYVNSSVGNDDSGDGSQDKPYMTIQKAIKEIPKDLDGNNFAIKINGSFIGGIKITGNRNGSIYLSAYGTGATVSGELEILDSVHISFQDIYFVVEFNGVKISNSLGVEFTSCTFIAKNGGQGTSITSSICGFYACTFQDFVYGIRLYSGMCTVEGGSIKASGTGITVARGRVSYVNVSITANVNFFTSDGGRIYTGAQTSIGNY